MNFVFITRRLRWPSWLSRRPDRDLALGRRGERAAARYLERFDHRVLERNYRCAVGEVDLISVESDTLVFVEVKTRSSDRAADPLETVRPAKWARVERAARWFVMERSAEHMPCRFDLVTIVWPPRGTPRIEHIENAYQARQR